METSLTGNYLSKKGTIISSEDFFKYQIWIILLSKVKGDGKKRKKSKAKIKKIKYKNGGSKEDAVIETESFTCMLDMISLIRTMPEIPEICKGLTIYCNNLPPSSWTFRA